MAKYSKIQDPAKIETPHTEAPVTTQELNDLSRHEAIKFAAKEDHINQYLKQVRKVCEKNKADEQQVEANLGKLKFLKEHINTRNACKRHKQAPFTCMVKCSQDYDPPDLTHKRDTVSVHHTGKTRKD